MFNIISLILGIIAYSITWNISSTIQNSQINSTTVSYSINLLFTISTVFVLLPFVFGNSFTHNILNLLMIISYLIILLVLFFSISKLPKIPDLPDYWYNTIPTILFMILMLIYTQFNITKSIGFTAILFGLYFSIFNLVYYFTKKNSKLYDIFLSLCGISLIIFGYMFAKYGENYQYSKLKSS